MDIISLKKRGYRGGADLRPRVRFRLRLMRELRLRGVTIKQDASWEELWQATRQHLAPRA
jgi:hypothetical protein